MTAAVHEARGNGYVWLVLLHIHMLCYFKHRFKYVISLCRFRKSAEELPPYDFSICLALFVLYSAC
jgi:hypothetical protein